jgi:hypothetical protein
MERPQPGQAGESLPADEWVLRLVVPSKDFLETGQVSPEAFALSSEDRRDNPPRLSVWAERLTHAEEAWQLMGGKPAYRLVVRMNVDVIRALRPNPELPELPDLDVQWHPLVSEAGTPDMRAGADGHAGIVGLHVGSAAQRKSWRRRLARLGSEDVRWLHEESSGMANSPETPRE